MKTTHYLLNPEHIPIDFRADPDGETDYDTLVRAAGFDPGATPPPKIGALAEPWFGHPEGAAVVAHPLRSLVAIVEAVSVTQPTLHASAPRSIDRAA